MRDEPWQRGETLLSRWPKMSARMEARYVVLACDEKHKNGGPGTQTSNRLRTSSTRPGTGGSARVATETTAG